MVCPILIAGAVATAVCGATGPGPHVSKPLSLHPENPHYFSFRGQPTLLITSGEHYGAVLNLDFDYTRYLDTLAKDGLNNTRTFVGAYVEPDGAFNIARNTLAPTTGRFICPWARSDRPGYPGGGNIFDLARWDDAFFARLKDFVSKASARAVVVEVNLFCPFYGDEQWALSPMHPANNVDGIGPASREDAYTLDRSAGLLAVQEEMVRKIVTELNGFDNVYYETMNEPYCCGVPQDWQWHIADVIADTEAGLPHRHLISQNIANGSAKVENVHPHVSILNFHYAWPPDAVAMNWGLNRALGDNETGFAGQSDARYRMEGWAFILAGGALYNNLDYSFAVGHEDGSFAYPEHQPGGGSAALRKQLGILARFMRGFDFIRMAPAPSVIAGGLPEDVAGYALAEAGKQYAIYLCRPEGAGAEAAVDLRLSLPAGDYRLEWVSPLVGEVIETRTIRSTGGRRLLRSPEFGEDVALRARSVSTAPPG